LKLRYSVHSPYARKVRVVAHELGISERIELLPTTLGVSDTKFFADNPLAKVPVLLLDDGTSYHDSDVICEFLDAEFGSNRLVPPAGASRWKILTSVALANGLTDVAILLRQEQARAAPHRSAPRTAQLTSKIERCLARFDEECCGDFGANFDLAGITLGSTLDWLTYRFGREFVFADREHLANWFAMVASRPSMRHTGLAHE
jgi:glutathione S-transferase